MPANVRALSGQRGSVGKAMVHQDAETGAVEPSDSREAAGVVECGLSGGFQKGGQPDQCSL